MEMLIYILNVGAVFMYEQVKSNNAYKLWRAVKNEWNSFKILMCQNYHMLFAKSSHNIKKCSCKILFSCWWTCFDEYKKVVENFFLKIINMLLSKKYYYKKYEYILCIKRIIFYCEFKSKCYST